MSRDASPVTVTGSSGRSSCQLVVGARGVGVAHGVEDEPGEVDLGRAPAAVRRRVGRAGAGPPRASSSARPARRCATGRASRPRTAARGGSARRSRGSRRAGCAARGWRPRRTGAAASRCPAGPPARAPTWSSMWLSAAPTWPTSVAGSASGTRSASSTSPRSSGSVLTRRAVAATRSSGSSSRRTSTAPITPATASVIAGDDQLGRHEVGHRLLELGFGEAGDLHGAVEPGVGHDPVLAERRQVERRRTGAGRHGEHGRRSLGGKTRSLPPRVRTRASVTWPSAT